MPHQIGFVDNSVVLAHYAMLDAIRAFGLANGWTILRYDDAIEERELIMMAPGMSGLEEIYCGVRTYHDVEADYYNMTFATMTGYVPANAFADQPGMFRTGVPTHNQRIDYWMTINGQRLAIAMKVGTPVYCSAYVGKFLPFATPGQYPYPVVAAGMLGGEPATRFSDVSYSMGYKGNTASMGMRFVTGIYQQPHAWPWGNGRLMGAGFTEPHHMRPTGASYKLQQVVLHDDEANIYGNLDGIYAITGFDNVVENTLTVDGDDYVVIQDVFRSGFDDYFAMRLDP